MIEFGMYESIRGFCFTDDAILLHRPPYIEQKYNHCSGTISFSKQIGSNLISFNALCNANCTVESKAHQPLEPK